jgi:hypothetical protein
MSSSEETIAIKFYSAFQIKNANEMCECYHPDLEFEDPAFGKLSYNQTCAMWKMLCESAKDLVIEHSILKSEDNYVEVRWIAEYTFSKTGKFVHNEIIAQLMFKDGKIIQHTDNFDLFKWAKQAMGLQGWLIGGTPFFRKKLQQQTNYQLARFMEKNNLGGTI